MKESYIGNKIYFINKFLLYKNIFSSLEINILIFKNIYYIFFYYIIINYIFIL